MNARRMLAAVVSAGVLVASGVSVGVAPAQAAVPSVTAAVPAAKSVAVAKAAPSRGDGVVCSKRLLSLPPGSEVGGVDLGNAPLVVQVRGMSCGRAFADLRDWAESGEVGDGFELVDDGDGDPDSVEFVDDQDTKTPADDDEIEVRGPYGASSPSGSTVNVISSNVTPVSASVTKGSGSGTSRSLSTGQSMQVTGYASGDPYDVGVAVSDGDPNRVKIQTWSSLFDHKVEIYVDGLLVPKCTWLTLAVNESGVCTTQRARYTVTRIADDTTSRKGSSKRYQYQFSVDFNAYPSGSTVNLISANPTTATVNVSTPSVGTTSIAPKGSIRATGYVEGASTDVGWRSGMTRALPRGTRMSVSWPRARSRTM